MARCHLAAAAALILCLVSNTQESLPTCQMGLQSLHASAQVLSDQPRITTDTCLTLRRLST